MKPAADSPPPTPPRLPGSGWLAPAAAGITLALLFAAAALTIYTLRAESGRGAFDEINYHEPAIRAFVHQWPRVDVSDYLSATTPGYHLLMAAAIKAIGPSETVLRGLNLLIGCTLVGLLAAACARRLQVSSTQVTPRRVSPTAILLAAPLAASMYILSSGAWLLPDNSGWLLVLTCLLLALELARDSRRPMLIAAAGLALLILVLFRQVHIWAAAPIWVAAAVGAAPLRSHAPAALLSDPQRRLTFAIVAGLATLPAFALLAWFRNLWGGLTPPTFQLQYGGLNPAAPAFILALIGFFSIFFAPALLAPLRQLWLERRGVLLTAALLGALAALIPVTTYSLHEGRWTGLWNIARIADNRGLVLAGRTSIFMLAFSTLGAVALAGWVRAMGLRHAAVLLSALAGFTAAQAASFHLWQRYSEPLILIFLALAAAAAWPAPATTTTTTRRLTVAGLATLTLLLAAQSIHTFRSAHPAEYYGFTPGGERIRIYFNQQEGDLQPIPRPPRR